MTGTARDAAGAPVLVLFTSGTTGRPKGATFTNEHLVFNVQRAQGDHRGPGPGRPRRREARARGNLDLRPEA
ncbi:MAG TPA: AMP-binding protein [Streptosporangiaceae bacterium]|nr:AMP-binding protein [Streptosporangiaceae bacterium]